MDYVQYIEEVLQRNLYKNKKGEVCVMTILDIIEKKRDKQELSKQEIEYFIKGYTEGTIADYQAAALVMAIFINGMTKEETTNLTLAMANSGEILDVLGVFGDRP